MLQHLQQRNKWLEPQPNLSTGDMVVIKDDRFPPSKWHLGRVMSVKVSKDGLVRSAFLRTAAGISHRPIVKLIKLPTDEQVETLSKGQESSQTLFVQPWSLEKKYSCSVPEKKNEDFKSQVYKS